eukprot:UN00849
MTRLLSPVVRNTIQSYNVTSCRVFLERYEQVINDPTLSGIPTALANLQKLQKQAELYQFFQDNGLTLDQFPHLDVEQFDIVLDSAIGQFISIQHFLMQPQSIVQHRLKDLPPKFLQEILEIHSLQQQQQQLSRNPTAGPRAPAPSIFDPVLKKIFELCQTLYKNQDDVRWALKGWYCPLLLRFGIQHSSLQNLISSPLQQQPQQPGTSQQNAKPSQEDIANYIQQIRDIIPEQPINIEEYNQIFTSIPSYPQNTTPQDALRYFQSNPSMINAIPFLCGPSSNPSSTSSQNQSTSSSQQQQQQQPNYQLVLQHFAVLSQHEREVFSLYEKALQILFSLDAILPKTDAQRDQRKVITKHANILLDIMDKLKKYMEHIACC